MNLKVSLSEDPRVAPTGVIVSSFGKSGKFKATFRTGPLPGVGDKVYLHFRKFPFDERSKGVVRN